MLKKLLAGRDKVLTGTITFDKPAYDDTEALGWRKLKRIAGSVLMVALLIGGSWVTFGTPYLRWDEPLANGKDGAVLSPDDLAYTRYVTFGESRRVHAGEYGEGLPWVVLIPWGDVGGAEEGTGDNQSEGSAPEASIP